MATACRAHQMAWNIPKLHSLNQRSIYYADAKVPLFVQLNGWRSNHPVLHYKFSSKNKILFNNNDYYVELQMLLLVQCKHPSVKYQLGAKCNLSIN